MEHRDIWLYTSVLKAKKNSDIPSSPTLVYYLFNLFTSKMRERGAAMQAIQCLVYIYVLSMWDDINSR